MKKRLIIGMSAVCALLAGILLFLIIREDKTAPKIYFTKAPTSYSKGEDESVLLEGVEAEDPEEGDVSDSLVIENIFLDDEVQTAVVIYAARDSHNNVGKASLQIEYLNGGAGSVPVSAAAEEEEDVSEDAPVITLKAERVELTQGEEFSAVSQIDDIKDDKDEDTELWTKVNVSGDVDVEEPGEYELSYTVTDSDGNRSKAAKLTVVVKSSERE